MNQNMTIDLRWIASHSASCFHAAEAVARKLPIVDETLRKALAEPTQELDHQLRIDGLPERQLWQVLVALSCQIENNHELAQVVLRKTVGHDRATPLRVAALAGRIADVEAAMRRTIPGLVDELMQRGRPLREQWEGRSPGLLHGVASLSDSRLLVPRADVVLVRPVLGGGGGAHLSTNTVRIEAVLTNNLPALPEVVRLGWLLLQLNCDLPMFGERVPADRLSQVTQLAMLPIVLKAAERVELAQFDEESMRQAVDGWHLEQLPSEDLIDLLMAWWKTFHDSKPPWDVALASLERLLFPADRSRTGSTQ